MQHVIGGYRGLRVIVDLNKDRMLAIAALLAALYGAAYVASI